MKQIFKSKQGNLASMFKTTALAAVLASTLMAASAEAAVLITGVTRSTLADNGVLAALEDTSTALSGVYNQTLARNFFFDEGSVTASASQNTNIADQVFSGTGSTEITQQPAAQQTRAVSQFTMLFTLTESYILSGLVTFKSVESPGFANDTEFQLTKIGSSTSIRLDEFSLSPTLSGTLDAGDYFLDIVSRSGNVGNIGSASSSFDFSVVLTELGDTPPPNNVPEPGSLALMGAGVLAAAASRRKRPLQPTHT
jgi:hypothetical protein